MPFLGPVKEPASKVDRIIESIDCEFMFEGFPGFELGVLEVEDTLRKHGIKVGSVPGQKIIRAYVEHCLDELYGDFERWADCPKCAKHFKPDFSVAYANVILTEGTLCAGCSTVKH
jgi:hypothetical protein